MKKLKKLLKRGINWLLFAYIILELRKGMINMKDTRKLSLIYFVISLVMLAFVCFGCEPCETSEVTDYYIVRYDINEDDKTLTVEVGERVTDSDETILKLIHELMERKDIEDYEIIYIR